MKHTVLAFTGLLTLLAFSGCKKSGGETVQPQSSKEFYIQAKIDDKDVLTESDLTGASGTVAGAAYASSGDSGSDFEDMVQTSFIQNFRASNQTNTISVLRVKKILKRTFDNAAQWKQEMYSVFKPGDYPYGSGYQAGQTTSVTKFVDGMVVEYYDASGKRWSTDMGSTVQTGSTFKLTSVVKNTDPNSAETIKQIIAAEFSCKLYDGSGATKTLSAGKLKLRALTHPNFLPND